MASLLSMDVASDPWNSRRIRRLALAIVLVTLALHLPRLLFPVLLFDDFWYLRDSWTWETTQANLWKPVNEHVMPLTRLTSWLLIQFSDRAILFPYVLAWKGPLMVLVCQGLLYLFLRRELGHPVYGLLGMLTFGVTTQYVEAVSWYSATFVLDALACTLLGLLSTQAWSRGGPWYHLALTPLWSTLALCAYGGGLLTGGLLTLHLLLSARASGTRRVLALLPLLGTALFLALSLPKVGELIWQAEHYDGETAAEAIRPEIGLLYSARSLVDNLLLGQLGISAVVVPLVLVPFVLLALVLAVRWWWRLAPQRSLLVLGLACIVGSYGLIYSARAGWRYEQLVVWSRYQVFSQLGLVLFLAGGLPRWHDRLIGDPGRWWPAQTDCWRRVLLILWLMHAIRGLPFLYLEEWKGPRQHEQLRDIDRVDALCRQHRIGGADARAALDRLPMAQAERENGWVLLRGSDDPLPHAPADIRRLLQQE